jgi:hypothetical protein
VTTAASQVPFRQGKLRRKIMATIAFSAHGQEAIGRGPWTSNDSYELCVFLVRSCGIVGAAVFLYSLGPALGVAVLVGGLAAWSKITKYLARTRAQSLASEKGEYDGAAFSKRVPFWLRWHGPAEK